MDPVLVECTSVEVQDAPVIVMEDAGPHDCMRRVCFYAFSRASAPGASHPRVEVRLQEVESEPRFEVGKMYELTIAS